MCGRYVCVQKVEIIEKRFNVTAPQFLDYKPSYNISPGKFALVITDNKPKELQLFQFGLTPFWAKKRMYLFNARAEGDGNKDNNPAYSGGKGIINKPAFRKPIRSQRCLIIADAFIEGTEKEKLNKANLVYLKDHIRPFAFAGIWDSWQTDGGEILYSFAIITTTANRLLQKIGHPRSPVLLPQNREIGWLNKDLPLANVTRLLEAYQAEKMNAYPISDRIKNPKNDDRSLIEPIGERLFPEYELKERKILKLHGMGQYKRKL